MKRTFTSLMKNNPDDYVYDENHLNGIVFRMIEQNLFPPFKKILYTIKGTRKKAYIS